jgi:hypothetical protein
VPVADWISFRTSTLASVVELVRTVADARDPGEHGHGVEVVISSPRARWWKALFDHDNRVAEARIVVTRPGGEVGYPFSVQLVTAYGGDAAHRLLPPKGWAGSNSAGLAFLVYKGRPGALPDYPALVTGTVNALLALRRRPRRTGWRARIDRAIHRG